MRQPSAPAAAATKPVRPAPPMTPLAPFEPIAVTALPTGPQWLAQVKWDGVRMLAYYEDGATKLINRRGNERTERYPELSDARLYCSAASAIFDGECIALHDGKPSFHHIMKRDRLHSPAGITRMMELIPATYMIFDVLYCDGKWLLDEPLSERQQRLQHIVMPQPNVRLVDSVDDPETLLDVVKRHRLEGIVCKDRTSRYTPGGKDSRWQKLKLLQAVHAVVGGVSFRDGAANALLLGVPDGDSGALRFIGRTGPGKLDGMQWRELAAELQALRTPVCPFLTLPAAPSPKTLTTAWVQPQIAVLVHFMEWTANLTMRQPVLQSRANKQD